VCEHFGVETKCFTRLAKLLSESGRLAVKHGRMALATFQPVVSARLISLREQVLALINNSGVNPPARGNLMKDLNIPEAEMHVLEKLITEDGTVMVLDGNFMLRSLFDDCRQKLLKIFETSQMVGLGAFRDAIGTNRKIALAMLDAFDGEGLTRRVADGRVLAKPLTRASGPTTGSEVKS
jgi:selenocysteine-specific elongation factor